jgi:hypothetical protein
MPNHRKNTGGRSGLAALAGLRSQLPSGPQASFDLVVLDPAGCECARLPIAHYPQKIGRAGMHKPTLPILGAPVVLSLVQQEDGRIELRVVGFFATISDSQGRAVEDTTEGASVHVDGRAVIVVDEAVTVTPASQIRIRNLNGGSFELRLVAPNAPRSAPVETPVAGAAAQPKKTHDLIVRDRSLQVEASLDIDGWLEIARGGALVCGGTITCLGALIEEGGRLECGELVTNILCVDNGGDDTVVKAECIRARVVHTVQRALEDLIARGALAADYWQHFGGELNPSWDYAKGRLLLRTELYRKREDDGPVELLLNEIRAALTRGENVFVGVAPLVLVGKTRS